MSHYKYFFLHFNNHCIVILIPGIYRYILPGYVCYNLQTSNMSLLNCCDIFAPDNIPLVVDPWLLTFTPLLLNSRKHISRYIFCEHGETR